MIDADPIQNTEQRMQFLELDKQKTLQMEVETFEEQEILFEKKKEMIPQIEEDLKTDEKLLLVTQKKEAFKRRNKLEQLRLDDDNEEVCEEETGVNDSNFWDYAWKYGLLITIISLIVMRMSGCLN